MTAFVTNAKATLTATVHRSTTCRTSNRYFAMLVADIAKKGAANRTRPRIAHASAGARMNMNDHAMGHRSESPGQTHFDKGLLHGFIVFDVGSDVPRLSRDRGSMGMERKCGRCRTVRSDFKEVVDPDLGVMFDSVCRGCRAAEPKRKPVKPRPKPALKPESADIRSQRAKVPLKEAREALQAYKLGDVRDPVSLITGPCHFTGIAPAMCLDLLDRRGRADDGNVVPCGYYVRAARGKLGASEFVALCTAISDGTEQTVAQARESLAMSARYDAAGGRMFMDMCKACRSKTTASRHPR